MASGWPPKRGVAFTFTIIIRDADGDGIIDPAGLSAKISKDDGAEATLTTTPVVVNGGSKMVKVSVGTTEATADHVAIVVSSTSTGAKDAFATIFTDTSQVRDALQPTIAGRTIDVLATGEVPIDHDTSIGTIAASQIEAGALDGKGDWNIGKTGYSLISTGLDAIVSTATGMVEIAKAVWDRALTGATHNIATSAGRRLRQLDDAFIVSTGTAQAGAATTITLVAGESAVNNIYNGDRIAIIAGTGQFEHAIITAYNGTTKVATISPAWIAAPDATSQYQITPASVDVETWDYIPVTNSATTKLPEVDSKSISDSTAAADSVTEDRLSELDAANLPTDIDAILADTNELQTDWTDGGRLDLLLDALITQIDTAAGEPAQGAPPVSAKLGAKIDYIYKSWRNKKDSTSTLLQIYNDAGTVVDHKATQSEAAGTTTADEIVSGP